MQGHRLVVAPRSGLRRAPNKRYRIYESEYLARISHTRSTASAQFSALTALRDPQAGHAPCQTGPFAASRRPGVRKAG